MSFSAGARFPTYRRTTSRAATSCSLQPGGMLPTGADGAGVALGAADIPGIPVGTGVAGGVDGSGAGFEVA